MIYQLVNNKSQWQPLPINELNGAPPQAKQKGACPISNLNRFKDMGYS